MPPEPRVLIIAPSPVTRAGLAGLLAARGVDIRGEAPGLAQGVLDGVDVCVFEGVDLQTQTGAFSVSGSSASSGIAAVLLDQDVSQLTRLRAIAPAGWALLHSDVEGDALAAAVRAVHTRLNVLSPVFDPEVVGRAPEPIEALEPLDEPLSEREHEVLEAAGRGLPSKLIALELGVSESTVKFHLSAAYAKLGAGSRTEAISKAARRGLITL
jgi:DNA-binding NarL/FixJ family response regulator